MHGWLRTMPNCTNTCVLLLMDGVVSQSVLCMPSITRAQRSGRHTLTDDKTFDGRQHIYIYIYIWLRKVTPIMSRQLDSGPALNQLTDVTSIDVATFLS